MHLDILNKFKGKTAGIFVDEANIFYIQKELGRKIDWIKTKKFLSKYFKINLLNYYLGIPIKGRGLIENSRVKKEMEDIGLKVKTKPLKKIYLDDSREKFKHKCNFDVEISFDIARHIKDMVMCFEKEVAWEFRKIYHLFFEEIRKFIEKNKKVIVVSTQYHIAKELVMSADRCIDLKKLRFFIDRKKQLKTRLLQRIVDNGRFLNRNLIMSNHNILSISTNRIQNSEFYIQNSHSIFNILNSTFHPK